MSVARLGNGMYFALHAVPCHAANTFATRFPDPELSSDIQVCMPPSPAPSSAWGQSLYDLLDLDAPITNRDAPGAQCLKGEATSELQCLRMSLAALLTAQGTALPASPGPPGFSEEQAPGWNPSCSPRLDYTSILELDSPHHELDYGDTLSSCSSRGVDPLLD